MTQSSSQVTFLLVTNMDGRLGIKVSLANREVGTFWYETVEQQAATLAKLIAMRSELGVLLTQAFTLGRRNPCE